MKGKSILFVALLAATMAVATLAGCSGSGQPSSSTSDPSGSPGASSQAQNEFKAELKALIADAPAFKSVTITEEGDTSISPEPAAGNSSAASSASGTSSTSAATSSNAASGNANLPADAGETTISSKTIYKFDESKPAIKTSSVADIDGIEIKYVSDGDQAVMVTDKAVYSGTTAQFDQSWFKGSKAYLTDTIGDLGKLVDCADKIEKKDAGGGGTLYVLTLDPKAYTAQDPYLSLVQESPNPVESATLEIGFDKDGYITSTVLDTVFAQSQTSIRLALADFDKTTVEEMPQATGTYEDMQNDVQKKLGEFADELGHAANDTANMTGRTLDDALRSLSGEGR